MMSFRINSLYLIILLLAALSACKKSYVSVSQSVTDIDGNIYSVVKIADKLWMSEDLKTTRLNDGTEIPKITDPLEWGKQQEPAYCWYKNDEKYVNEFGSLYNWYTVTTDKICPQGWYVPSDSDWTDLENYLENNGYNYDGSVDPDSDRKTNNMIGKSLASITEWKQSSKEGTIGNTDFPETRNKTGFNALPGGYRDANGFYQSLSITGGYWSTTEYTGESAWYRKFMYSSVKVLRDDHNKRDGFGIRCVKDDTAAK